MMLKILIITMAYIAGIYFGNNKKYKVKNILIVTIIIFLFALFCDPLLYDILPKNLTPKDLNESFLANITELIPFWIGFILGRKIGRKKLVK